MNKRFLFSVLAFVCIFCAKPAFAANYTYNTANVSCKDYLKLADEKVYKAVPRSFAYKDRELQFAVQIDKTGKVLTSSILKSSGSEKYDNKVLSAVSKVEFGTVPNCTSAKTMTLRYDIRKQSKIIPIPIPIWF